MARRSAWTSRVNVSLSGISIRSLFGGDTTLSFWSYIIDKTVSTGGADPGFQKGRIILR